MHALIGPSPLLGFVQCRVITAPCGCVVPCCVHQQALDDSSDREKFAPLLPAMLQCLAATLNAGDEASAQEAIEMFIEGGCDQLIGLIS